MPHQRTILPGAQFYGYLVGLSLERGDPGYSKEYPGKMYARFELREGIIGRRRNAVPTHFFAVQDLEGFWVGVA